MAATTRTPGPRGEEVTGVPDVVVLCWPGDAADVVRLQDHGVPCLLLVDAEADPPEVDDLLVDWVRLPADERDLTARVGRLRRRAGGPAAVPTLDAYGRLTYADRWVELTPIEERLAEALVERFATVVSGAVLAARGWPAAPPSANALRVHLHRLRRRVEPIGLEVRMLRGAGYLLGVAEDPPGRATSSRPRAMKASATAAESAWRRSSSYASTAPKGAFQKGSSSAARS
jgi:two-component system, OmpR family, response regulator